MRLRVTLPGRDVLRPERYLACITHAVLAPQRSDYGAFPGRLSTPGGGRPCFLVETQRAGVADGGGGSRYCRISADIGADLVKVIWNGAAGVMFGRRVFRADRPEAVPAGLRAVTHDGVPVDDALQRI